LESIGEVGAAKGFYQAAKDYLSVVRLLCYNGEIEEVLLLYHVPHYFSLLEWRNTQE
jgi:hypothetical protein